MTRLDATVLLWENEHGEIGWLIDKIYDDFEAELASAFDEGQAEAFETIDMERRKAYLDGSNDCFKALKEAGKLK